MFNINNTKPTHIHVNSKQKFSHLTNEMRWNENGTLDELNEMNVNSGKSGFCVRS